MKLRFFILLLMPIFMLSASLRNYQDGAFIILDPTERRPAHAAVLIMVPPDHTLDFKQYRLKQYRECRWQLGEKVWEQYMNSHPNVDCYFLQSTKLREGASEQTWIEGNTIYVGEDPHEDRGILLSKTIAALEKLLPKYTHFFRTNVNAFVNLKLLNEYAETHHQSMFTGPLWQQPFWHLLGYGLLFSADVATHIVNEYRRLEGNYIVSHYPPEDLILTSLATGIFPYYDQIPYYDHIKENNLQKGFDNANPWFGKANPWLDKGIFPYYDHIKENNLQKEFAKANLQFTCCPTLPLGARQLMCGSSLSTTRLALYGVQLDPAPSFEEAINYCREGMSTAILYRIRGGFDLDKMAEVYEYLLNNIYPELPTFDLVEYAKSFPTIRSDNS